MRDALGHDIVIGKLYGYSNRQNGHVKVRVGRAEKLNDQSTGYKQKSVTLRVLHYGSTAYDRDVTCDCKEDNGTISVASNAIFPLPDDIEVLWDETKR